MDVGWAGYPLRNRSNRAGVAMSSAMRVIKLMQETPITEWRRRLAKIEDTVVRGKVANVLWWDIVSQTPDTHELNDLRAMYELTMPEPVEELVIDGLLLIGYPDWYAKERGRLKDDAAVFARMKLEAEPAIGI